jgi:hypothetical protein
LAELHFQTQEIPFQMPELRFQSTTRKNLTTCQQDVFATGL